MGKWYQYQLFNFFFFFFNILQTCTGHKISVRKNYYPPRPRNSISDKNTARIWGKKIYLPCRPGSLKPFIFTRYQILFGKQGQTALQYLVLTSSTCEEISEKCDNSLFDFDYFLHTSLSDAYLYHPHSHLVNGINLAGILFTVIIASYYNDGFINKSVNWAIKNRKLLLRSWKSATRRQCSQIFIRPLCTKGGLISVQ